MGAIALALSACGSSDSDGGSTTAASAGGGASSTAASKAVHAAYLTYGISDYVQAEEKGLKSALEPNGGSVTMFNSGFDPQKETQQCQDAVTSGRYNAIVLAPVSAPTGVPCVAAAKAAGIPVVTIETAVGKTADDIHPQVPGVVGVVTVPVAQNSKLVVDLVRKACEGTDPCKIIGEVGTPNDPLTNDGIAQIRKQIPNADVVQVIVGQYDPSVIAKVFPDALAAHPDANVFLSAADTQALAVIPAIKQAGKLGKIKIIGAGGSRLGTAAVEDGTLFGTTGNWPQQAGAAVGKMLIQAVNGQKVDPNAINASTLDTPAVVTKDNVDQFKPEWGATRPAN